jgi:GH15 family glucan-1,4-alpha-glucosidase
MLARTKLKVSQGVERTRLSAKPTTAAFGSDDIDASVLLLPDLGVVEADDPRFASTVAAIERALPRAACHALRERG